MEQWRGKVAVVTGASSGIGAEVAVALAVEGILVVGLARRKERIEELAARVTSTGSAAGRIHALKCDVTDEADVKAAFAWIRAQYGTVHVLVNNAGMMSSGFLTDSGCGDDSVDEGMDRLRRTMDVNVMGACLVIREAIQVMNDSEHKEGGRHILLINSILGHRIPDVPVPMFNIYPATKFALTALAQTFRQELRFQGRQIKFTCISPGMVDTDMLSTAFRSGPLKALPKLTAKDVSAAALYALATPPSVQINDVILEAVPVAED